MTDPRHNLRDVFPPTVILVIYGLLTETSIGKLFIAAATAASQWKDWRVIHSEDGPFFNEMLGDLPRWKATGILSILVQESPAHAHQPTPLRLIDFSFGPPVNNS